MEWVEGEGGRRWLELGGVKVGIRQRKRPLAREIRGVLGSKHCMCYNLRES